MRKNRIIGIAISLLTALTMLAVPASAYLEEVSGASSYLESDSGAWMIRLTGADKDYITDISKIEMYISLKGDAAAYRADMENGVGDFTGFIGLGAAIEGENVSNGFWQQFGFSGLKENAGGRDTAAIKKLGDTSYLFTGDLTGLKVSPTASDATISLKDWGNFSEAYRLAVDELIVYGPDGSVAFRTDSKGNMTFGTLPASVTTAETTVETTAETTTETTTEETTTTTEAETTTEETTTEETTTAEETTTSATTTTAAATTTTAAVTSEESAAQTEAPAATEAPAYTTSVAQAAAAADADFGSRDSSLLIVGIVAGVVIIAVIVVLVMILTKKKK
ncbi:MAG TPA: hypothetical protein DDX72_00530 [Ruminococcaceae bacterium]|nr:hypothetical protein [Oscillospiraceae bacterium]